MSFTSALPANVPKYSYTVGIPAVITAGDSASGGDAVLDRAIQIYDLGTGAEEPLARLPTQDSGTGGELYALTARAGDSGAGGEVVAYASRAFYDKGTGGDYVGAKTMVQLDAGTGAELTAVHLTAVLPDPLRALSSCVEAIDRVYGEVGSGNYIRPEHFNVVHTCILYGLSTLSYYLERLAARGVILGADTFEKLSRCWSTASEWRKLYAGDILMPEHRNTLIDALKCFEELYYMLPRYRLMTVQDSFGAEDYCTIVDTSPVADRTTYVSTPIEYFTNQLSPPGGYVQTPPPPYTVARVDSLRVVYYGIDIVVYNVTLGHRIRWVDSYGGKPCASAKLFWDGWMVSWFEDMCFTGRADWDYDDIAVGIRMETLDGGRYLHMVVLDIEHGHTLRGCVTVLGVEYCSPNLGGYSGPMRVAYEAWIRVE